ncbi:MAG: TonB-dependent receptor [Flavobacteriales bacterium]|nr:TonB-dependent receptor [Flavobacteriales bacterium]
MKRILPYLLFLLPGLLRAQVPPPIDGRVLAGGSATGEPVPFAAVSLDERSGAQRRFTAQGDAEGRFSIPVPADLAYPLVLTASAAAHTTDSLVLDAPATGPLELRLEPATELKAAEVVERQQTTQLSTRTLINTETITARELKRAACCDLSESFESNATVDVSFTDAVSGTKALRMLGLDGKYAQMSVENIPFIRGLSTGQGLTLIPGTWINSINVSKGIGTAVNGPNAITGQIDLCLVPPDTTEPFLLNLYGNSQGRFEANIHHTQRTGRYSANLVAVHGNLFNAEMDQNNDAFMDQPRTQRFNVMDRWLHRKDNVTAQFILRYVTETRSGGQTDAHAAGEGLSGRHYRVEIGNELTDAIGKYGFVFRNDPSRSIGLIFAARQHHLSSAFGDRRYDAEQKSLYGNAVYQMLLSEGRDDLKAGLTMQWDDYTEVYNDSSFARNEVMPGAFTEYTLKRGSFTGVAGVRADANSWFGTAVSPRLHAKYDLGPLSSARLSVGHAFRTAVPLAENASALASSRVVRVEGVLPMERAWNVGASLLHKWKWLDRRWAFTIDVYTTRFTDQVVSDLDRSPQQLVFYGLSGRSFANSVLTDVQVGLTRHINMKLAYRWYDVRTTYDGVLRERPFTPTHRGMVDLAYESRNERFRADATLNVFGSSRIPGTASNPEAYRLAERAPSYATLNAQVTWVAGAWEVYVGGENLTSTLQMRQIIAPEDPFGPYFDASMIWGPTNKAMIYAGLRHVLHKK